jgi:hypothetical protein
LVLLRLLRGSTSLAKYCAKKLPPTTTIVAIQNGKPVFVREAPKPPLGNDKAPLNSSNQAWLVAEGLG